jgi:hypothetical protein
MQVRHFLVPFLFFAIVAPSPTQTHSREPKMSNAEKFAEATAEFPQGALPDEQVYEHPLVKR